MQNNSINRNAIVEGGAEWFLRLALATGFLAAVTDRFGLWGPPGASNVAWGAWGPFVEYVGVLNWFVPTALLGALAWITTIAEVTIAFGLLIGWRLPWFALASGLLLLMFALTMTVTLGIKAPFDFSVFAASAGGFFLAAVALRKPAGTKPEQSNLYEAV